MSEAFPKGTVVMVAMDIRLPEEATYEQVNEWLRYSLGHSGGCALSNPLVHHDAMIDGGFRWRRKP